MRKVNFTLVFILFLCLAIAGCGQAGSKKGAGEKINTSQEGSLVYLSVVSAKASSFDQTPDWAPEPNPMAATDGDMLTRWSSDYAEGPQWIYFDLGKTSVVSDVIVRWEKAYATDYEILVSNDAKNWRQVYHEKNGRGGTMESVFAPVKCRYVKMLGVARVNTNWGISIWEVEIYGPASMNDSRITKQKYLKKGDEEQKKKEAEKLLNESAAPVVPISKDPFQKGVVFTSWMSDELSSPASDIMLTYIKKSGYDTVAIMVPAYQDTINSTKIYVNDKEGGDTPDIASLKHAIGSCHKLGLRVMLKPHVDPRTNEARVNIMPSEKWFDNYQTFVVKYARFAQDNNVEILSIGTELEATTFDAWAGRWNELIDNVEKVYKGKLTYSANWTEYKEVPFWKRMDFIGIDAYFPLTKVTDPTMKDLTTAWSGIADKIEKWRVKKGLGDKGVIFSEIGYPSAEGAAKQPWAAISNTENQQEQADCLDAVFEVMMEKPWFKGFYIWQYFPQERWSPLGFTIKGKKAEKVVKKWLCS